MVIVESAGVTDVGRKRKGNEDSLFLDDDMQLYIVADGMGGHKAGEVASGMIVETIPDYIKHTKEPPQEGDVSGDGEPLSPKAQLLMSGILKANEVVHEKSKSSPAYQGMGSTVSAVYFTKDTLVLGNVGDSPIYLIRNGEVETVSVLHTMMAEFMALASEGAKLPDKKFGHMLTRAMGTKESVQPDVSEMPVVKDDILVICSDGLSDLAKPEEVLQVVTGEQTGKACQALVDMALERGGHDNTTVIVLKVLEVRSEDLQATPKEPEIEPAKEPSGKKPDVVVDYDTEFESCRSAVLEISVESVFIETREAVSVGEELMLTISVLNEKTAFTVNGKVADRKPKGIVVKFENLKQEQVDLLKSLEARMA
ncbi:protein phosphatase 2C domain-containing protein [Thermodesulfobacteriota bacterium]